MTSRRKHSGRAAATLVIPALTAAALALTAVAVDRALVLAETWEYSAIRLERSFFLTSRAPLYPDPARDAALNAIYGPVAPLAYLPATLAASPAPALLVGHALSMAFFFLPPLLLHLRRPGPGGIAGVAGFLLFWAVSIDIWPLTYAAFTVHTEAPALALGMLACLALLARGKGSDIPSAVLASLAAVLAVWTKQVMAPLPVAMALWLWWAEGRRAAVRLLLVLAAVAAVVSALLVTVFGPLERLYLYLVTVPARHGLAEAGAGTWLDGLRVLAIETAAVWVAVGVAAAILASGARSPARARTGPAAERSPRRQRPWTLLWLVALCLLPLAVAGRIKVGGDANASSHVAYFALAGATLALARAARPGVAARRTVAGTALALLLAVELAVIMTFEAPPGEWRFRRPLALESWPVERAYRYARAHPGTVYFPRLGLAHVMAEGRVYHQGVGLIDLRLAGIELSPDVLAAHLPPRLAMIALVENGFQDDFAHLPFDAFTETGREPALPGFVVHRRP